MQKTFRRSSDCSNFNDSVNHSTCIERPEFFFGVHSTNWGSPEIHLCRCSLPGCGELVPWLTEELSERNIFHHSFPPCLGQCTRHSVTWCNVRAVGRFAVGGGWVSVCRSAVCMCATEPWLPHYLIKRITLLFNSVFYRTVGIFLFFVWAFLPVLFLKDFKGQTHRSV